MNEKPLILLVDDEENFLEIFSTELQSAGFEVVAVDSGEAALAKLKEVKPALVLLDVQMPELNGAEILEKIKADPNLSGTKVAFLTNLGNPDKSLQWTDEKFAREVGAVDYIKKTDDLGNIRIQIEKIISGQANS
ncbi:MAG: response regulator [bacterium]|nr:response regulator [bacterium]